MGSTVATPTIHSPGFHMRLDMFFKLSGGLEFLAAGLAGVDLASGKFFAVLLHVQSQLTL